MAVDSGGACPRYVHMESVEVGTTPSNQAYSDSTDDEEESTTSQHSTSGAESASEEQSVEEELSAAKLALQELEAEIVYKETELTKVQAYWTERDQVLQHALEHWCEDVKFAEHSLHEANHQLMYGNYPPTGPRCLRFVEEFPFSVMVCLMILGNVVALTMSLMHPQRHGFAYLDESFTFFFIVELALRWTFHGRNFLCGACSITSWRWLDLLLVVNGVVIILWSFLGQTGSNHHSGMSFLKYFRVMRLLRYFTVMKVVHEFRNMNLSWIEGEMFQRFMMGTIGFNSIVMGLEAEYPDAQCVWDLLGYLFLFVFTVEITLRLLDAGAAHFFTDRDTRGWNIFDLILVLGGLIELLVLPSIELVRSYLGVGSNHPHSAVQALIQLARIVRLFRILRLARLVRKIKPLYTLIVGVFKAMQGMSWVMVLTVTVIYIAALVGVKLVGPSGLLTAGGASTNSADHEKMQEVMACFPDVFNAIFNMFKVMQMDFSPLEPLFDWAPASRYIIIAYVVISNWAIFSILTAVVSDEMARVTEELEQDEAALERRHRTSKLVDRIFEDLDKSGRGYITQSQLDELMQNGEEINDLCQQADLGPDDLQEAFELANAKEAEDRVTHESLLDSLGTEQEAVKQGAIMKLEKRMDEVGESVSERLARMEGMLAAALGVLAPGAPPKGGSPEHGGQGIRRPAPAA